MPWSGSESTETPNAECGTPTWTRWHNPHGIRWKSLIRIKWNPPILIEWNYSICRRWNLYRIIVRWHPFSSGRTRHCSSNSWRIIIIRWIINHSCGSRSCNNGSCSQSFHRTEEEMRLEHMTYTSLASFLDLVNWGWVFSFHSFHSKSNHNVHIQPVFWTTNKK